jgi:hypothetical protein
VNLLLDTYVLIWWDEGRGLSPVFERYDVERIEA